MFHVCIRKFDVTDTVQFFLETKQGHSLVTSCLEWWILRKHWFPHDKCAGGLARGVFFNGSEGYSFYSLLFREGKDYYTENRWLKVTSHPIQTGSQLIGPMSKKKKRREERKEEKENLFSPSVMLQFSRLMGCAACAHKLTAQPILWVFLSLLIDPFFESSAFCLPVVAGKNE